MVNIPWLCLGFKHPFGGAGFRNHPQYRGISHSQHSYKQWSIKRWLMMLLPVLHGDSPWRCSISRVVLLMFVSHFWGPPWYITAFTVRYMNHCLNYHQYMIWWHDTIVILETTFKSNIMTHDPKISHAWWISLQPLLQEALETLSQLASGVFRDHEVRLCVMKHRDKNPLSTTTYMWKIHETSWKPMSTHENPLFVDCFPKDTRGFRIYVSLPWVMDQSVWNIHSKN